MCKSLVEPEVQCYALRSNTGPYIQANEPSPHPNPISFTCTKCSAFETKNFLCILVLSRVPLTPVALIWSPNYAQ